MSPVWHLAEILSVIFSLWFLSSEGNDIQDVHWFPFLFCIRVFHDCFMQTLEGSEMWRFVLSCSYIVPFKVIICKFSIGKYNLTLYSSWPSFPLYIFPYSSVSLMLLLMLDLFSFKKTPGQQGQQTYFTDSLLRWPCYYRPLFFVFDPNITFHVLLYHYFAVATLATDKNIRLLVNIKGELDCFLSGGVLRRPS